MGSSAQTHAHVRPVVAPSCRTGEPRLVLAILPTGPLLNRWNITVKGWLRVYVRLVVFTGGPPPTGTPGGWTRPSRWVCWMMPALSRWPACCKENLLYLNPVALQAKGVQVCTRALRVDASGL